MRCESLREGWMKEKTNNQIPWKHSCQKSIDHVGVILKSYFGKLFLNMSGKTVWFSCLKIISVMKLKEGNNETILSWQ